MYHESAKPPQRHHQTKMCAVFSFRFHFSFVFTVFVIFIPKILQFFYLPSEFVWRARMVSQCGVCADYILPICLGMRRTYIRFFQVSISYFLDSKHVWEKPFQTVQHTCEFRIEHLESNRANKNTALLSRTTTTTHPPSLTTSTTDIGAARKKSGKKRETRIQQIVIVCEPKYIEMRSTVTDKTANDG